MTLNEFITKYKGKGIDFDGYYGFQCVDLYRQYVQDVLQIPQSPSVNGAKDIWDNYLKDYFDSIPNTPEGVPQKGDIMVWGSKYGKYGHVAVVTSATTSYFNAFSQNDPIGSLPAIKKYTSWGSVLGWLHPKEKEENNEQALKDKISDLETENKSIRQALAEEQLVTNHQGNVIKEYERDNTDLLNQLSESRKQRDDFKFQAEDYKREAISLESKLKDSQADVNALKSQITDLEKTVKDLKRVELSEIDAGLLIQELIYRLFRR